jgi:hypothetical protein
MVIKKRDPEVIMEQVRALPNVVRANRLAF